MAVKLFGTSGIRGKLGEKVTVGLALDLGRALGGLLNGTGEVGVGTDARTSNTMLRNTFVAGAVSSGINIVDLGVAPMPAVGFWSTRASASVIITASHNPPGDNGFKFFRNGREFIRSEEVVIENAVRTKEFLVQDWQKIGRVHKFDLRETYLDRVKRFLRDRGPRERGGLPVLVDLANGAAVNYTPHLLRDLGFEVTTINSHPDGYFPGRPAEPSPRNLVKTMKIMERGEFSVALCHDGDGDRLAVIDEKGRFVDQNRVIALFAADEVQRKGGGRVIVSIDTSNVIDEMVENAGGEVARAPLGSLQEFLATDKEQTIVFASEPWKPIFTELGGWMDGVAGAARFVQMIVERGVDTCTGIMQSIPEYPMLRDFIPCPDEIKSCFIKTIKGRLVDSITGIKRVIDSDGVRVEREDGSYVLVRVSGTEPKARLYIGARTQQTLDKLEGVTRKLMHETIKHCQK